MQHIVQPTISATAAVTGNAIRVKNHFGDLVVAIFFNSFVSCCSDAVNIGTKQYFVKDKSNFFVFLGLQAYIFFDIIQYQREMKKNIVLVLSGLILLVSGPGVAATSCSRANLTRCLDSACAINVSSNPAARCQYCGTSGAGAPPAVGMRSVSVGASAKYNISDKELKSAPKQPAERYAWAAQICLGKVTGCTTDDVSDVYDSLIEQSCKAAGVAADIKALAQKATEKPSKSECVNQMTVCVLSETRCGVGYVGCAFDEDFNKNFTACSVEATGCDEYLSDIRGDLIAARDTAIERSEDVLQSIVSGYERARNEVVSDILARCANNSYVDNCINTVCATNMPNKCAIEPLSGSDEKSEREIAAQMCEFYNIACGHKDLKLMRTDLERGRNGPKIDKVDGGQ